MASSTIETKVYDQDYFSSSQVSLYIGDVLIDEVTGLQVSVQQRKLPVYGYASQLFDKVAKGTVIVEGTFTINFKESGYLTTVLERHKSLTGGQGAPVLSPFISGAALSQIPSERTGGAKLNGKGFVTRRNVEQVQNSQRIVDSVLSGQVNGREIKPEEYIDFYRSLSGFNNEVGEESATSRLAGNKSNLEKAESIFELFEDKVWGSDTLASDSEGRRGDSNKYDNFTIYVTYGDYNRNDFVNHTVKRIDNIYLIGQAQTIMLNGEPIQEQYNFLARNIV